MFIVSLYGVALGKADTDIPARAMLQIRAGLAYEFSLMPYQVALSKLTFSKEY